MSATTNIEAMTLLGLPLEVRHTIFEYAAARDVQPKKLLRYWFEKKETKELVAREMAANPDGPAPRVVQSREYDDESDIAEQDEEDQDDNDEDSSDEEDEANEDDEQEEDADEDEDEDDDEMEAEQDEDDEAEEEAAAEEEVGISVPPATVPTLSVSSVHASSQANGGVHAIAPQQGAVTVTTETEVTVEDADMTDANDSEDEAELAHELEEDAEMDEEDQDDAEVGEAEEFHDGADGVIAQTNPPQQAAVVQAAPKWRHIPRFMRITQCPPPTSLFLVSKQIHDEAKTWFYDVAVLRIEATGSFAHTSFFEEAFSQITEAAFSPMENIRKVEVTFVWDTTWIRSDTTGCVEAIFPALLRQRADFVHQILSRAPDLEEVTVHWHDSAQDDESANLMIDILAPFHMLPAKVKAVEHYIATDAKPNKRSIAGRRRMEFQCIADAGLDRLF